MLQVCDAFSSDIGGTLRVGTEVTSQSKVKDGKTWLSPVNMSSVRKVLLSVGSQALLSFLEVASQDSLEGAEAAILSIGRLYIAISCPLFLLIDPM